MKVLGIIPCRYGSTRFPGKPLVEIGGKSMVQRVFEQASQAKSLSDLYIATDDERIARHARNFTANVLMTSPDCLNGTERCAEALQLLGNLYDFIINIQGDEPFIEPAQIELTISCLTEGNAPIATLVKKMDDYQEWLKPSVVKAVLNKKREALYFSRMPIPHIAGENRENIFHENTFYKHIGIYGFKAEVLREIVKLPVSALEKTESLEQLRWLENGYTIKVKETTFDSRAVDTREDLERL